MPRLSRRSFVKQSIAAGLGTSLAINTSMTFGDVRGANDTINVGVAGIHGRGGAHIDAFAKMDKVRVTQLIDPDTRLFKGRVAFVEEKGGNTPECFQDVRKALEDKTLDALAIATPNHWHSLMTIWACQAEKDVYVEKPLSHNVFEGRQAVKAARKYNRVVQHGTQQRSDQGRANEIAGIHGGGYGKLLVAKGYCCKPRWSIGFKPVSEPPEDVDFDLWLGPAPAQPYHGNLVHYNWHWFWDTGNGDMGNQGVHQMDVALWGIKDGTLPKSVWSLGGRWVEGEGYKDQGETPNMELSVFDFGEAKIVFETRGLVGKSLTEEGKKFPSNVSNEFYTTEGMIKDGWLYPKNGGEKVKVEGKAEITGGGTFAAFIAAMRTRKREDNNADVEIAHHSSAICHLGNISYRLGKQVPWTTRPDALGNDKEAIESFELIKENLEGIGIDLTDMSYQLGPVLKFDPVTEKFIDNDEANALLTREYRAPYVVGDEV